MTTKAVEMLESRTLEFKSAVTDAFLKTVSAFSNGEGGTVLFGVDDDGSVIGLDDPKEEALSIENKVNDSVSPRPFFSVEVREGERTVALKVEEGPDKPYLYRSRAYVRSGSSTVPADALQLRRLVLEGRNLSYDQLPYEGELSFGVLGKAARERLGLDAFDDDTLRTLGLMGRDRRYNNAAALLADENGYPVLDVARFGDSINVIEVRRTIDRRSVLAACDEALELFRMFYVKELVESPNRRVVELVPEGAFREALANAVAHRAWDAPARIRVLMHKDRIEVSSPGGLPQGVSEGEYLAGRVSFFANPVLGNVMFRLGLIEALGTGIQRIRALYEGSVSQPTFEASENSLLVTLPLYARDLGLSDDQQRVLDSLERGAARSAREVAASVGMGRTKVGRLLRELVDLGAVEVTGRSRSTRYRRSGRDL